MLFISAENIQDLFSQTAFGYEKVTFSAGVSVVSSISEDWEKGIYRKVEVM